MDKLISDSTHVESTGQVKEILHAYIIGNWSIEVGNNNGTLLKWNINT